MKLFKYCPLVLAFTFFACSDNEEPITSSLDQELTSALQAASSNSQISFFQLPASDDFTSIPQDPKNPITTEKVELGKMLYHETAIAQFPMSNTEMGSFSCATCHFASAGFQANRQQGIADGGEGFGNNGLNRAKRADYEEIDLDVQPIKSPTIMNSAYQEVMLWNGQFGGAGMNLGTEASWEEGTPKFTNFLGFEGIETQAMAGLTVHRLWSDNPEETNPFLEINAEYIEMFEKAFPNEPINRTNTGMAIAAFERTVLSNEAPFQQWLSGDLSAMTDRQKEGAILFFGKASCATANCHTGPALNSMTFHGFGMKDLSDRGDVFKSTAESVENLGRGGFTKNPQDNFKFKTPQLYNLKQSPFYGHGSSFTSIREVVEYKNTGVAENVKVPNGQLSSQFKPLGLTVAEVDAIVDFLENGLYDPALDRYTPNTLPSGNCFPVNDPMSKADMGCN